MMPIPNRMNTIVKMRPLVSSGWTSSNPTVDTVITTWYRASSRWKPSTSVNHAVPPTSNATSSVLPISRLRGIATPNLTAEPADQCEAPRRFFLFCT